MTAIYKGKEKPTASTNSWRPVSVCAMLSKLFEAVVAARLELSRARDLAHRPCRTSAVLDVIE